MPLSEVVTEFFDKLKSRSSGFASFEYVCHGRINFDGLTLTYVLPATKTLATRLASYPRYDQVHLSTACLSCLSGIASCVDGVPTEWQTGRRPRTDSAPLC